MFALSTVFSKRRELQSKIKQSISQIMALSVRGFLFAVFPLWMTACMGYKKASSVEPQAVVVPSTQNLDQVIDSVLGNIVSYDGSYNRNYNPYYFDPKHMKASIANEWFSHRVRSGDTLGRIARKYRVSLGSLKRVNKLKSDLIRVGRFLKIPGVVVSKDGQEALTISDFWDTELAQLLAKESKTYATSRKSLGACLKGVRIALTNSLKKVGFLGEEDRLYLGGSAHQFKTWAMDNIRELCHRYKLVPIVESRSIPQYPGLIYVYHRGRCGFSKRYGHVETVVSVDPITIACSDNCRVVKRSCMPDLVLAPCKHCPKMK